MISGPVRPKWEKSPCGFAHSSGITIADVRRSGRDACQIQPAHDLGEFPELRASGLS